MYTCGLKPEERDQFFTVDNIYIIYLLNDLTSVFRAGYLRAVDRTNLLASTVYRIAATTAENIEKIATEKADCFKDGLSLDKSGNLLAKIKKDDTVTHTIILQRHSKSKRNKSQDEVLEGIKVRSFARISA